MKNIYNILLLFILIGFSTKIVAQRSNCDNNAGGEITVGSSCSFTTWDSDNSSDYWDGAAGCGAGDRDDVWGWFIATGTSTTITYSPDAGFNAILTLFTGACDVAMTSLTCSNTGGNGVDETITYATTIGTRYRVRVQLNASDATMTGDICVYSAPEPVPSNDLCSSATSLPCGTTNLAGSTISSTNTADPIGCASNYGVWYTFVGDGQQTTISSTAGAGFNHEMVISTGSCGSLTNIICDDGAAAAGTESHTFIATNGVTYYVYIAHANTGSSVTGTFTISRSCTAPPATPSNDLCSGATNLPCGTTNLAGTTINTTNTAHGTACGMSNYGVWYSFVGDGNNTTITISNSYDIELSISSGSCGTFTNIICTDFPETHTFATVNGVTYYVYVAGWLTGDNETGTFDISRTCAVPGTECTPNTVIGALPYVQTGFNTSGAGDDFSSTSACASSYMNGDDYVFTYTPAANTCVNIALTNTSTWVGVFVTQGCPTTGSCVAYNTNSSGNPSIQDVSLTGGVTYFITVSTFPSPQTTPFDISVTACPPPITACSGTFLDPGGAGNYGNNAYVKTTYCSGSTDCISFNFTSFNTESFSDYLDVYDGATTASPLIDSYSGTELNGVTLTSSSSCLTFVFDSDGSVTSSGWSATISCAACPPPPPPVAQDCAGGTSICSDASFSGNSDGYGFIEELSGSNQGCLSGGENQTSWYFFEAATAGTLEFGIKPQNGTDDYDFAMWGPYPSGSTAASICPPAGAPVRCSFAAGAPNPATGTGLKSGAGDATEGAGGDDIVNPLALNVGDVYILVIDNYSESTSPFDIDMSLTSGLTLNCVQLPVELLNFNGFAEDGFNLLKWTTAVEINNDYFEIEKSLNGVLFEKIAQVTGAGNSNTVKNYEFVDNDAYKGITYYRLKQIDYNGTMSYSSVVAVKQSLGAEVSVFPNPTIDKVKMNFVSKEDGTYKVIVSDVSKVLYEQTLVVSRGNQIVNFDYFTDLAKGFYIVQIIDEDGNIIKTERVVKQ
jgi:hypothetical protein